MWKILKGGQERVGTRDLIGPQNTGNKVKQAEIPQGIEGFNKVLVFESIAPLIWDMFVHQTCCLGQGHPKEVIS